MWPKVDPLPILRRGDDFPGSTVPPLVAPKSSVLQSLWLLWTAPEKHFSSVPRGQPPNGTPVLPSQAELTAASGAQPGGGGRAVDSAAAAGWQPLYLVSLAGLLAPTNPCAACSLVRSVRPEAAQARALSLRGLVRAGSWQLSSLSELCVQFRMLSA